MPSQVIEVLLDSTYVLPSFGIGLEGLSDDDLFKLREAKLKGRIRFYCLSVIWVEIIGKVCKEKEKSGENVGKIINLAIRSLMESGFYEWLTPSPEAIRLAFELRMLGHRDNIDNLLYATSLDKRFFLLTMDVDLERFLERNNFKTDNLIDHKELLKKIK
ncbi:MAG: hypothetical protein N3D12_04875 [Candidatus Methanomethyliaceae archaeon]|nr:hypothetical protein [Candidatus Methanomethyliaceae archaeon]